MRPDYVVVAAPVIEKVLTLRDIYEKDVAPDGYEKLFIVKLLDTFPYVQSTTFNNFRTSVSSVINEVLSKNSDGNFANGPVADGVFQPDTYLIDETGRRYRWIIYYLPTQYIQNISISLNLASISASLTNIAVVDLYGNNGIYNLIAGNTSATTTPAANNLLLESVELGENTFWNITSQSGVAGFCGCFNLRKFICHSQLSSSVGYIPANFFHNCDALEHLDIGRLNIVQGWGINILKLQKFHVAEGWDLGNIYLRGSTTTAANQNTNYFTLAELRVLAELLGTNAPTNKIIYLGIILYSVLAFDPELRNYFLSKGWTLAQ